LFVEVLPASLALAPMLQARTLAGPARGPLRATIGATGRRLPTLALRHDRQHPSSPPRDQVMAQARHVAQPRAVQAEVATVPRARYPRRRRWGWLRRHRRARPPTRRAGPLLERAEAARARARHPPAGLHRPVGLVELFPRAALVATGVLEEGVDHRQSSWTGPAGVKRVSVSRSPAMPHTRQWETAPRDPQQPQRSFHAGEKQRQPGHFAQLLALVSSWSIRLAK
jgi:hypothetical protein